MLAIRAERNVHQGKEDPWGARLYGALPRRTGRDSQDLTLGTHFDSFLVIAPATEGRGCRDYARGLLSQQWNTGFP